MPGDSTGEGQQIRVPGHQIAEMALAKLCLVTGQQKYLDQAKFFLDQRGHTTRTDEYSQAHKPVVEQDEPWDMLSVPLICMQAWQMWPH